MSKYDFGGYATKNDLQCADGRVIRHGAFEGCDGLTVPLVWQHRHDGVDNVLGHALLENRDDGVYAYCSLNDTPQGKLAREEVKHGDVTSLSIYANQLKQRGSEVLHGVIREVSLVLSGANPGAKIDNLAFTHSDYTIETLDDEADIFFDAGIELVHSEESEEIEQETDEEQIEDEGDDMDDQIEHAAEDKTIGEVFDTLTEEQKTAVYAIIGAIVDDDEEEEVEDMKHNAFDLEDGVDVLSHSDMEAIFADAKRGGSLKEAVLEHGITDIEVLFPEAQMVGGGAPAMINRRMEWVNVVMNGIRKSPFARIKSTAANITMEEARARGYIKGNQKVEEQIAALKRTTDPQTIYKLQKLDRDDIVDITDFDVVAWMKNEMRMMLDEEVARSILVGDGRGINDQDKIFETHIRPIWTDDEVYASHLVLASSTTPAQIVDEIIKFKKQYRGSGQPTMFIGTDLLTELRLLKDGDGYRRYKTDQELADDLRVGKIVEVDLMDGLTRSVNGNTRTLGAIIVNLADYTAGANKGGEVTLFDDFDLNYNKYEYLIETRMSGALYQPKSALVIEFAATAVPNIYVAATVDDEDNPSQLGLYEKQGVIYILTKDTEPASGKTYYELA